MTARGKIDGDPIVAIHDLSKDFGGARALDKANLEIYPGTIHGLVGQNGAGKSTLIKILAGIYRQDSGTIKIRGESHSHLTPRMAEHLGIHFIHQDRLLVPSFTVGEALFLGNEPTSRRIPLLSGRTMREQASEMLRDHFDVDFAADALISELTPAQQQIVQITRAVLRDPTVVVFDEPTAALVRKESMRLFEIIQQMRAQGITIIYISHYLNEIEMLCDRVTVLRNGVDVGTVDPGKVSAKTIISMMIARNIEEMFPKNKLVVGRTVLDVKRLCRYPSFSEISLTVRQGEIVGMTGLVGSGIKELIGALFGLIRPESGQIFVEESKVQLTSPSVAVEKLIALVPEDRRRHGIALDMSVKENVTMASLPKYSRFGLLQLGREKNDVKRLVSQLSIKTPGPETSVRELSGGNQQKVVLAKWLSKQSSLYVLDEPTVGVDVAAKVEIYRLIGVLAEGGAGVLMISSDLLELLGICDRILVMYRGRIRREFAASETNSDELLACATGTDLARTTVEPYENDALHRA
jgi:ribose transport system ATP-binding protein